MNQIKWRIIQLIPDSSPVYLPNIKLIQCFLWQLLWDIHTQIILVKHLKTLHHYNNPSFDNLAMKYAVVKKKKVEETVPSYILTVKIVAERILFVKHGIMSTLTFLI